MPPRHPKLKSEDSNGADSTWRSRFPVARIKKIMQADEDIGKVAQVVPVIISKALELFMASMIAEASQHSIATGHKRVLPGHLKMAVQNNKMFDFLDTNVENVADPIHVEARANDDRKRRSRVRKVSETTAADLPEKDEDNQDVASPAPPPSPSALLLSSRSAETPAPKRVKVEDVPSSASRSMSIANMITPTSADDA